MRSAITIGLFIVLATVTGFLWPSNEVGFNADIRPILNDKCLSCHGGVKQSGGFNMISREDALKPLESGEPALIPGNAEESILFQRITHPDPQERMPLDHPPLADEEIKLIKKWLNDGATWETHWAYIKPDPALTPPDVRSSWVRNGIDRFVLQKLKEEGLSPAPEADRDVLIRRLSFDLTGLPPTLEDVDAFLADTSPDAYEKVVDRLLNSPHFGERWASMWLDLARYGDSQGYQKDPGRNIWAYRDWVIDALNNDMPFDQFTIEQLAGDLLPNATNEQILATAFHRNTMSNDEGGTDDEEFRVAAVLDRVNTTFEIWQGITMSCVQCHGHPYDPFLHEEYYEAYAFFNNTQDSDKPHEKPVLRAYRLQNQETIKAELERYDGLCDTDHVSRAPSLEIAWDRLRNIIDMPLSRCFSGMDPDAVANQKNTFKRLAPPRTPIMRDFPPDSSRVTHVFERGNWLMHGDEVQPDVPASLPALPQDYPRNRLGLAQWLVHPDNPLTARVIVNRFWEQLFGIGIVETLEDFGSQGEAPSHPDLLDWLAVQYQDTYQWNTKTLLKNIVMSATYRQHSAVSEALLERDPANRLLARGPRFRLSAEQIRDQALAVAGLLSPNMHGPGVMPPQPEGTWQVIRGVMRWETAEDEDRYRRALYTFWRRSSPYPSMITFDSPSREFCVSRRIRTNTPLQALVAMNDIVYMEASTGLALRMQREGGPEVDAQLSHGFRLAMATYPTDEQLDMLRRFYAETLAHYQQHPDAIPELIADPAYQQPGMAALINTANVLMNMDAFLNKS